MKKIIAVVFASAALAVAPAAVADTLDDILARGKIVVGTKADYPPWGMRGPDGEVVGLEVDLINDFARRLSERHGRTVTPELVVVVSSNRMQFLEQGKIDLMIATMSDKPERRKVVGAVQPNYYSSGVAIFSREDSGIDGWDSVSGRKICGIQGAWYNKEYGLRNGAEIVAFKGVPEVEKALLDGRCDGWLYDDSAFIPRLHNEPEKWAGFRIATPVVADVPWAAAVRKEELTGRLGAALSEAIVDWHKSGRIVALEAKWGIPRTKWVVDMFNLCNRAHHNCDARHDPDEEWPRQ